MAFPTINGVITTTTITTDTMSHAVNLPASIAVGELLLVQFGCSYTPIITPPAGWTILAQGGYPNVSHNVILWRIADGTEGATITIGTNQSNKSASHAMRIGGHDGLGPRAGAVQASYQGILPDPPACNAALADDNLWFVFNAAYYSFIPTVYPAGYVNNQGYIYAPGSGAYPITSAMASRNLNAVTDDPGTFTWNSTSYHSAVCVVVGPAFVGQTIAMTAAVETETVPDPTIEKTVLMMAAREHELVTQPAGFRFTGPLVYAYFETAGIKETELTPTIQIWHEDGTLLVDGEPMWNMREGWYVYNFTEFDDRENYYIRADGGDTLADVDRWKVETTGHLGDQRRARKWLTNAQRLADGSVGNFEMWDDGLDPDVDPATETQDVTDKSGAPIVIPDQAPARRSEAT